MHVALVYDRLNKIGGAEKVLIAFHELFPDADWYTSVYEPKLTPFTKNWKITTSWLNKVPFLRTHHQWIPYLMPFVFEFFDFSQYDLVISIGSAESKGIITKPGTFHLNYCLTPTRYLYSHQSEYLSNPVYRFIANFLRKWDLVAATRPDQMIAISTQVKSRIKNIYKRDSDIIFPPVDTGKFSGTVSRCHSFTNYYLTVARLVPYKKIDILIKAFNQNGKTLIVIGRGEACLALKRLAKKNVHLLGSASDSELVSYYSHARAFLQANEEDFGISMVEAQAAGIPVIAYGYGGAVDIVKDQKTGILVEHNTVSDFVSAVDMFETMTFDREVCRTNAKRFDSTIWARLMSERITQICHKN